MNSPERHKRVSELFLAACEHEEPNRSGFLDEACANDPSLRGDVETLLARDSQGSSFLDTPALLSTSPRAMLPRPDRIGGYKVLDVIGEGGMGVVYLAEQESPCRRVALKVVRPGVASERARRRFEFEGELLGRLQHPFIGQIFEAGIADTGFGPQPFFAMEFVEGSSLIEYACQHDLNIRQRLELFIRVCEAVQHAHQKGIIHRDLKPANILVNDSGNPKILDFGVARTTDADVHSTTLCTNAGQLVGTVAYMSPEQVAGDPNEIDVRSDIYALGVVLYELLAGCLPYESSGNTLLDMLLVIRDGKIRPLGTIKRTLRGDVESIAARALEQDKARRYDSASDFAADIRRHLSDQPVAAHRPAVIYQFRKFVRRNVGLSMAAAFCTTALILIAVVANVEKRKTQQAEVFAMGMLQKEAESREMLEVTLAFWKQVFDSVNPEKQLKENDPPNVSLRGVLEHAKTQLEGSFDGQPMIEARLRGMIGTAYLNLRDYEAAQEQLAMEKTLLETLGLGDSHPLTVENAHQLAHIYLVQNRPDIAKPLLDLATEVYQKAFGEDSMQSVSLMSSYARYQREQGDYDEAERVFRDTLDVVRRIRGENHALAFICKAEIAEIYKRRGRLQDAAELLEEVLDGRRSSLGNEHPQTLTAMNNLARLYLHLERYADAEGLLRIAYPLHQQVWGQGHRETSVCQLNLILSLNRQEKYRDAFPLAREFFDREAQRAGDRGSLFLPSFSLLTQIYEGQDRHDEIIALCNGIIEPVGGQNMEKTLLVVPLTRRGVTLVRLGRYPEAEKDLLEAFEISGETVGEDHDRSIAVIEALIKLYDSWSKPDEAAKWRSLLDENG